MTDQDCIEVIVAKMNGKQIQIRKMGTQQGFRDGKWYDVENPRWNFEDCDYRVKPEPRKPIEMTLWHDGYGVYRSWPYGEGEHTIRVREVIE